MWKALTYSVALPGVGLSKLNSFWSLTVERRRDPSSSPIFTGTSDPSYEDEQREPGPLPSGNHSANLDPCPAPSSQKSVWDLEPAFFFVVVSDIYWKCSIVWSIAQLLISSDDHYIWWSLPGGLQSIGSQRVTPDWSNLAHMHVDTYLMTFTLTFPLLRAGGGLNK